MKQKSGWKRITLLRKTSFKKRLKILAGYKRQLLPYRITEGLPVTRPESGAPLFSSSVARLWPVAVEKLHLSQNSQNLGDTKCLGKRERRL